MCVLFNRCFKPLTFFKDNSPRTIFKLLYWLPQLTKIRQLKWTREKILPVKAIKII